MRGAVPTSSSARICPRTLTCSTRSRNAAAPKPATSTLQTTPATAEGELERGVRATITRASNELNRIDYRVLNADAKLQYDTAKRFIRQADDAVKAKNLVFAKTLADKAATLADQLAGR